MVWGLFGFTVQDLGVMVFGLFGFRASVSGAKLTERHEPFPLRPKFRILQAKGRKLSHSQLQ